MTRVAFGILLVALGLFVVLLATLFIPPFAWDGAGLAVSLDLSMTPIWMRVTWLSSGVVVGAIGIILIALGPMSKPRAYLLETPSAHADGGTRISVSRRALLGMLHKAAQEVAGVRAVAMELDLRRKGWTIAGELQLFHSTPLKETCEAVSRRVSEVLERHTGIGVLSIDIEAGAATTSRRLD